MALTLGAESYKLCDVFRLCPTSRPETKDGSVSVEMSVWFQILNLDPAQGRFVLACSGGVFYVGNVHVPLSPSLAVSVVLRKSPNPD